MELDNNDAAVGDSIDAQAGAAEIDLYEELNAFAELSPEEQLRLVARPEKSSAEPEKASEETDVEHPLPEQVITNEALESLDLDSAAEGTTETAEASEKDATPQLVPTLIEAVESEAISSETNKEPPLDAIEQQISPEPVVTPLAIEAAEAPTASDVSEESTWFEQTLPHSTVELGESAGLVTAAEAASDSDLSKTAIEPGDVPMPLVFRSGPSGPLSGFNLPPELVYRGALSRGVCLACGAESGADDLFCLTCGVFIDEIASTLPSNPTCGECNGRIEADEIFCPWCGSAMPV